MLDVLEPYALFKAGPWGILALHVIFVLLQASATSMAAAADKLAQGI